MVDQAIIEVLDEHWRTVLEIRSKLAGNLGGGHELTNALRRLADAGQIERSAQPTPAPRRGKYRVVRRIAIEFFRMKSAEGRGNLPTV
jgi:hypothetical protein